MTIESQELLIVILNQWNFFMSIKFLEYKIENIDDSEQFIIKKNPEM
jgi:hypothetical protein